MARVPQLSQLPGTGTGATEGAVFSREDETTGVAACDGEEGERGEGEEGKKGG